MKKISLVKASVKEADLIYSMQVKSFKPLLDKYSDFEINPANEPIDKTIERIKQPFTDFHIIQSDGIAVGGIRIVKLGGKRYRVSPIFVVPEYQGKGIAQKVFQTIEELYNDAKIWELTTIIQELGNCYLYEKIGYKRTGWTEIVNSKMTLVAYEKHMAEGLKNEISPG